MTESHRPLLRLIRCLGAISMHVEMKWQTASRIETGRALIEKMAGMLEVSTLSSFSTL